MNALSFGLVAGLAFGALAVAPMFKMSFQDKRAAISAAFVERFMIALVIALVALPWPRWTSGLLFGTLLSVPSALITKARVPILVTGAVGGLLVGLIYPFVVR
jgi:hypothetical protein